MGHGRYRLWLRGSRAYRPETEPAGAVCDQSPASSPPFAERPVAGPPKGFAQAIGAGFSLCAFVLYPFRGLDGGGSPFDNAGDGGFSRACFRDLPGL